MKTKKEIHEKLKFILNHNIMYEELNDNELLEKVFRMYYDHSNKDKFSFIWNDKVSLNSITIVYNRGALS